MTSIDKKRDTNAKKLSGSEQVLDFLQRLEHPLKAEIEEVRNIILGTNDHISEHLKWNAPSFCINNQDRITFNLHGKGKFRLIFHCGSKVTEMADRGPLFEDDTNLLEWVTGDRATINFTSAIDLDEKREKLIKVISKWIEVTRNIYM